MFAWIKKFFKKEQKKSVFCSRNVPDSISPEQVNDPSPMVRFAISEAFNTRKIVCGSVDGDKLTVSYGDDSKKIGTVKDGNIIFEESV